MKNLYVSLSALCALCFQACSSDLEPIGSPAVTKSVSNYVMQDDIAVINNGQTLQFRNEEVFSKTLEKLRYATDQERLEFADSLGFQSLFALQTEADRELEYLTEHCASYEEFASAYAAYKDKYAGLFEFNTPQSEELFPYLLLKDPIEAYYTGRGKKVVVGDREISSEYLPSVQLYTANTYSIPLNEHNVRHDKRKVGLHMSGAYAKDENSELGLRRYFVYANFTAQKKNMFGWVRYSTVYNARFDNLQNFVLRIRDRAGNPQDIPVGVFYINTFYTDHIQILTGEQSGNWTLAIGYTDQGTRFQGNVKFWSRGIPEDKAGFMNIDVSFQL